MGKSPGAREDMGNSKQFGMGKTGHESRVMEVTRGVSSLKKKTLN